MSVNSNANFSVNATDTAAIGTFVGGDGRDFINNYSSSVSFSVSQFFGGAGADQVVLENADATLVEFDGGSGGDYLYYLGTTGTLATVDAGSENDTVQIRSVTGLSAGATLDGGDGASARLEFFTNGETVDLTALTVINFERLQLTNTTTAVIDTASLSTFFLLSGGTYRTSEATLDLTGVQVINASVQSDNALGTTFEVDRVDTALSVFGGAGTDVLNAPTLTFTALERDTIFNLSSIEVINDASGSYGNNDANTLTAPAGGGNVEGAGGDDTILSGAGDDTLRGGNGADAFTFLAASGLDQIIDFQTGSDLIDVTALGLNTAGVLALITESGGNSIIDFDAVASDVDEVTVVGVTGLTGADFVSLP